MAHVGPLLDAQIPLGDGPNTVSESTVSNTELSECLCPHRVPGRELSEFLSAYYLCDKANSPSFFAELTEFAPKVSEAQWVLFSETVLSKQYYVGPFLRSFPGNEAHLLGSDFIIFGPLDFFMDFVAGFFLLIFFVGKVPRKILQENPRQNPPKFIQQKSPTHFCRGPGQHIYSGDRKWGCWVGRGWKAYVEKVHVLCLSLDVGPSLILSQGDAPSPP